LSVQARKILKENVIDAEAQRFLETLFSFHPNKNCAGAKIEIGVAHGQAVFLVDNDPISVKKCLIGL